MLLSSRPLSNGKAPSGASNNGLPPLLATRRYADLSRPETRHAELGALLAAMGLGEAVDGPALLPDEIAVLNILRGKPDVKWTVSLIANRLASTQTSTMAMVPDVEGTVMSLRHQGFVYTDKSGLVHVSDKAVEFFRSRGATKAPSFGRRKRVLPSVRPPPFP